MRTAFFALVALLFLFPIDLPAQDSKENSDFKLAVSLYNDKMYDLALEQFRQFVNLYPNSSQGAEARYLIGLTQFKLKKYDDARYSFQNFALSYPDNLKAPDAWMNVAEVYLALNNLQEAALAFERVKTFNPKSKQASIALMKAADYYQRAGEREDAKRVLRVLTQEYSDPDVVLPGYIQYASLLMGDKDFEGARIACRKVTETTKDPGLRSHALLLSAQALYSLQKYRESENALNEVIVNYKSSPSYAPALLLLGSLREKSGSLTDAVTTWKILADDSVHILPETRQDALMELGKAASIDGDFKKSLQYFERAATISGARSGEAWFRAGEMAERTGDGKKTAEYYSRAVNDSTSAIDPRAILIAGIKGASAEKNFPEAVKLASEYRNRYPADANLPRVLFESAELCAKELKDYRKSIDFYEEILDKFPQSLYADDAYFGLGTALDLSGQLDEAVKTLESLEKKFPSSEFIDRAQLEAKAISLFELKNKETGLEKLALLIGDVIAQQSKGDLAYRLAEIYFYELKDYQHAASQYRMALASGLEMTRRAAAWFNLARSFDYLSLKERVANNTKTANANAVQAIGAYDSVIIRYRLSDSFDDAALARFNLKLQLATTNSELRKLGTDFLTDVPTARRKDRAFLVLANAYYASKNLEDAALTYKLVLDQYPQSESAPEALFQLGKALMGLAERDSAASILNRFLEKNPHHPRSAEAAYLLAQYESSTGHADHANSLYDLLERKYSYTDFATRLEGKRGDAYFNEGNYAKAVDLYTRQIQQAKNDFFTYGEIAQELMYKLGYSFEKLGNNDEAKRYYAEYITMARGSEKLGQVYYSLASIARAEGNSELASKYLQESIRFALASSDEASTLSLEAAELLFKDDQYIDAIARFSEVEQRTKNDSLKQVLQARIIVCYYRLDNVKEADKRSSAFIKAYPNNEAFAAECEFERGKYFLRKDDSSKAISRFENVVKRYKNTPIVADALFWMGRTYELAEKPEQAIAFYDSVLHQYPKSNVVPQAELSLGNIYYNLEQWDAASRNYKEIVDNESRSPGLVKYAMNNLALAYKQLKLYDAAMDLDRKYIQRYPDDTDIVDKKIDIGILYQNLGYYDQSILQLQKLLDAGNPDIEAELRYYIGEARFYKGEYQQAILEFLKVPYLVTKRGKADWISTSYYMAGQSYEKMSKFEMAITMYKKIIESKVTDAEFKTAAQREVDRVQSLLGKRD